MTTTRPSIAAAAIAAIALAACSSDDPDTVESADGETPVSSAPRDESAGSAGDGGAAAGDVETFSIPIFGGMEFDGPSELRVEAPGEFRVLLAPNPEGDDEFTVALVARVSQSASGQPVPDVGSMIEQLEVVSEADVEPGEAPISALGRQLEQYHVRGANDTFAFSDAPVGYEGQAAWFPDPVSDLYLADLGGSVMVLGAFASDDEQLERANELLRSLAPTMRLTTAGGEPAPLPDPDEIDELDFGPPPAIETATAVASGAPAFTEEFAAIEPGSYQLLNLGQPVEIDVAEGWWARPNAPGFVVLSDENSGGPYTDDLRMHLAQQVLAGTDRGGQPIGPVVPLDEIADIAESAPPNLTITNLVTDATVAGRTAVRFDATIDDPTACEDVPCSYGLFGPIDPSSLIIVGHRHRIWIVEDWPDGPLTMAVAAGEGVADEWFARADALIASMRIPE